LVADPEFRVNAFDNTGVDARGIVKT